MHQEWELQNLVQVHVNTARGTRRAIHLEKERMHTVSLQMYNTRAPFILAPRTSVVGSRLRNIIGKCHQPPFPPCVATSPRCIPLYCLKGQTNWINLLMIPDYPSRGKRASFYTIPLVQYCQSRLNRGDGEHRELDDDGRGAASRCLFASSLISLISLSLLVFGPQSSAMTKD